MSSTVVHIRVVSVEKLIESRRAVSNAMRRMSVESIRDERDGSSLSVRSVAASPPTIVQRADLLVDYLLATSTPGDLTNVDRLASTSSRGPTNIAQPIGDDVLGVADSGTYCYQLKGSRNGADMTSAWMTGESSTLRLASW